jgi:3-hydroxy-9,10-secoandrosta-1,3,5(10)-triene-9,17-dione monooxygenase
MSDMTTIDFVDAFQATILLAWETQSASDAALERTQSMAIEEKVVSREELLRRATDLLPSIRDRASEAETLRQIPPTTINDLKTAGLMRVPTPPRYGGYDIDVDLMFELAMQFGTACGSTGWCYAVWSIHNWMVGFWPEQAQDEYFSESGDVLSSSAFAPMGRLEAVDGGHSLTGRWDFSSGCDAATWAVLGAMGQEGPCMVLVPRSDYEIIDTWFVSGLRGTGSKDIAVNDAFVPGHRVGPMMGGPPNSLAFELHGRSSYRLPPMTLLPFTLCSPLVGMAQGALDEFIERLKGKTGPGRTAESVALQMRIAESSAEIDAARLLVRNTTRELIDRAGRGEAPNELEQAATRRTYGYVARLCVQAVNRLFEASGGHALYDSQAMQRFHRDLHAGSHQVALYWDPIAEGYGRAALGLPPLPAFR